ncbi:MAG TPA: hypothetical protein PK999_19265 [Nitrospira sp.]|nr:hypothetical protein [Nitrospira sp.]
MRNLLTSRIEDLLHIATKEDLSVQIRNVQVLSPHYMNGTDHYQLHVVRQIWRGKNGMPDLVFVMEDGSRQSYVLSDEESAVDDLVLAYDGSSISH